MIVYEWLTSNDVKYHLVGIIDDTHALYTSNRTTGGSDREVLTIAADGTATDSTGSVTYTPVGSITSSEFLYEYLNFPASIAATIDGATVLLDHIDALVLSDMRFRSMYHDNVTGLPYELYQVSQGVYNIFLNQAGGSLLYKGTVTV